MTIIDRLNAKCDRKRASDDEVARLAGMTAEEMDADTTAPDDDKIVQVLSHIPEWLRAPKGTPALIRDALSLCTAGRLYRVYATYNHLRQVTRFVARPYYGGVWFPDTYEVKLCDLKL